MANTWYSTKFRTGGNNRLAALGIDWCRGWDDATRNFIPNSYQERYRIDIIDPVVMAGKKSFSGRSREELMATADKRLAKIREELIKRNRPQEYWDHLAKVEADIHQLGEVIAEREATGKHLATPTPQADAAHADPVPQPASQPTPAQPAPTPAINPRDVQQFGRIIDTLAVLHETESTLRKQALRHIADHPEVIAGSKTLSLDDRIQNALANRENIRSVYGESRPVHPPEQMILAGATAALGGEPQHLGSLVYLSAQHQSMSEKSFRDGLNHPEKSTIDLGEQIERRIEERLASAESDWDTWRQAAESADHEPGDD